MSRERKNNTSSVMLIDERKKTKDALRNSKARHRALLENLPYKIFHKDRNSTYVTCNENFARDLGVTSQEIVGKNDFDFYPNDSAVRIRRHDKRIMDSGRTENIEEKFIQDGQQRIVHATKWPVRDEYGEVIGILGILRDDGESKKARNGPQESEERFREMIDFLPQTVFEIDVKGNVTFSNRYGFESFGYTPEDIEKGMNALQLFIPEERGMVGQNIQKILRGEKSKGHEYTMLRKDGNTIPVLIYSVPIISKEKTIGLRGIVIDITERKRTQDEQLKVVATTVEAMVDPVFMFDIEGRVVFTNHAFTQIFGLDTKDIIGKRVMEMIGIEKQKSEEMEKFILLISEALEKGSTSSVELTITAMDGNEILLSVACGTIRDSNGNPTHIVAVLRDITERKHMEEMLRESEKKFKDLFENANDLIQSIDVNGNFLYVNKKWLETLGYSNEELKELNLMDIIREDQKPHCMDIFRRVCSGESIEKVETIFKAKDGREINVEGNVNAYKKDGKFIATRGIFRDVTERLRSVRELHKTIEDLERFNRLAIGREHQMIELKREVNELLHSMGRPEKYKVPLSKDAENITGG